MIALLVVVLLAGVAAGPAMLSATAAGQQATSKPAAAVVDGVARERLKRLDVVLQEHVDQNRIAGIVVLVLRDGKPIYERALGGATRKRIDR
jgi:CubicO group peptidase (beta-lactamase class C family)